MIRLCLLMLLALPLRGAEAKIYKVLPTFIDKEGRHSLSPSLYERDAYQAQLRKHPEQRAVPTIYVGSAFSLLTIAVPSLPWLFGAFRHGGVDLGIVRLGAEGFIDSFLEFARRAYAIAFVCFDEHPFTTRLPQRKE